MKYAYTKLWMGNKILASPSNNTIYVLPMSGLTLTATYECDANCTQTTSDPNHIFDDIHHFDSHDRDESHHKSHTIHHMTNPKDRFAVQG